MGGETILALEDDVASKQKKRGDNYFSYWDFLIHSMYVVWGKRVLDLQKCLQEVIFMSNLVSETLIGSFATSYFSLAVCRVVASHMTTVDLGNFTVTLI